MVCMLAPALRLLPPLALLLVLQILAGASGPIRARAQTFGGDRRVDTLPASSWMDPGRRCFRMGVGQPVSLGSVQESWIQARLPLGAEDLVAVGVSLLQAGAFRAHRMRFGLWLGASGLQWGGQVAWLRRDIAGVATEAAWQGATSVVLEVGSLRVGIRGTLADLARDMPADPLRITVAAHLRAPGWAMGLSREDSAWRDTGRWRMGLSLRVTPALVVAVRGGLDEGTLVMVVRRRRLSLRCAVPLVAAIPLGPYLALDWLPSGGDGPG